MDLNRGPLNDKADPSLGTGLVVASPSANLELAGHSAQHLTPQSQALQFDPQRRAASKDLRRAVASITTLLKRREKDLKPRQRARKAATAKGFLLAIEAIVCNLAFLKLMMVMRMTANNEGGYGHLLSVPRSNNVMRGKGTRYCSAAYGPHFLDALHLMEHPEIGLIERVTVGGGFVAGGFRAQGTIRPTATFDALMPASLGWESLLRAEDGEVLILKGGERDPVTGKPMAIAYQDTAHTRGLRRQVKRTNAYLREAPLTIELEDGEEHHPMVHLDSRSARWRTASPLDFLRRTVTRTFSNGSWYEGGRLNGAFWETMRRPDRFRCLRIDGERIANVDFGQLYLRLAYLKQGLAPPEGDLYAIGGGFGSEDPRQREGIKKVVGAMLFAKKPLQNWPEKSFEFFPQGAPFRDLSDAIKVKHRPIAGMFGKGIGGRFAFTESTILIDVLLCLFRQGITALPLHDSVLVAASKAEVAKVEMAGSFAAFTGSSRASIPVKIDLG